MYKYFNPFFSTGLDDLPTELSEIVQENLDTPDLLNLSEASRQQRAMTAQERLVRQEEYALANKILHFIAGNIPGCDDKSIVLKGVAQEGTALMYASMRLRADRDVVMAAVRHTGHVLYYGRGTTKADREVVMEAVKQDGSAIIYASPDLQRDIEIAVEAIKSNPESVLYMEPEIRAQAEAALN